MQKLFTFILLAWTLQAGAQSPCYVRLNDASGYTPTQTQLNDLEAAACRLIDSLPAEFRDSFKVFDFGFYLHNETFSGGYPEAFQMAIQQAQASSKYYLLFGKQTDGNGMYTKFWVDLKLPETGEFGCLDAAKVDLFSINIKNIIVDKYDLVGRYPENYAIAFIEGMRELNANLVKLDSGICCKQNYNNVKQLFSGYGFIGEETIGISEIVVLKEISENRNGLIITTFDYANKIINFEGDEFDISSRLNVTLNESNLNPPETVTLFTTKKLIKNSCITWSLGALNAGGVLVRENLSWLPALLK